MQWALRLKDNMTINEAIKELKKNSKEKFSSTVELHINLALDVKKNDQSIRFTTILPNGTGKTKRVAVLSSKKVANADLELKESDLDLILNGKIKPRIDFDVLVAEPAFMSKIAKVAKILGPIGLMPNPKNGTVSDDAEKAVAQIKKGKDEVRTEKDAPVVHTIIGKTNFTEDQLVENFNEILTILKQNKPAKTDPMWIKTIFVSSTMGKSYPVDIEA